MVSEYLKLFGLLILALGFWILPISYQLKRHEQGASLAISLSAILALLHYSRKVIDCENYQRQYELMDQELLQAELAYQTYFQEQKLKEQYLLEPVQNQFSLPESVREPIQDSESLNRALNKAVQRFESNSELAVQPVQPPELNQFNQFRLSSSERERLNEIKRLRDSGVKSKNKILKFVWGVNPGGNEGYKLASSEYEKLLKLLD